MYDTLRVEFTVGKENMNAPFALSESNMSACGYHSVDWTYWSILNTNAEPGRRILLTVRVFRKSELCSSFKQFGERCHDLRTPWYRV